MLAILGILAFTTSVYAQEKYPSQPIKILSPFGPDSASTGILRRLGRDLEPLIGVPVVIINQPGGMGVVEAGHLRSANPDGYTIGMLAGIHAASHWLMPEVPYDVRKDFQPITQVAQFANLVVTADPRFRTLGDFVAAARAAPGVFNVGTMQVGSPDYLTAHLLKKSAGLKFEVVAYKLPADVVTGALRGDTQIAIQNYFTFQGAMGEGRLRPLAVTTAQRAPNLPDIPTLQEAGVPGVDTKSWFGLYAPAGTPKERVDFLNKNIRKVLANPAFIEWAAGMGFDLKPSTPDALAATMLRDVELQGEVVRALKASNPKGP
ncbi:hypothetical protein A3D71_00345 [Candidatus Kaiserbacteria bacterium RIFCSPHIGHO2_02_FULL_55_20]|uniref:Tripartite tricarboxylate transporter substrate binding protein n=1 Tax=Candidatus Kaiserbacteria bacterium RIFCSPHIGHO2_02_FULL_55_20 TaxID=1798497 RepID=A0A1F6DVZ1_9BACT|nr:MAG: hypothetical protein A2680_03960 [Candidatus Kaiserbacteria bacterium RIFCSPHIGHO2_01_FULL_55_37]OGG65536.1 MAG: hypothetical protein A3D71_00345 [Candidatus Kaiserbacteria bacterium RIFCSPHIGHO2_02_FULL_55_20]